MTRAIAAVILLAGAARAAAPGECRTLERRGKGAEADACYGQLARSSSLFARAEGLYGLRQYKEANDAFRAALAADPKNPDIKVRWGRMLLEPFNKNRADAASLFQEALEVNKNHAGALMGMALAASDGFENRATKFAEQALEADPKLVEAQELLAHLALEDVNPEKAVKEADKAIAMSNEALDAYAIRAAVELLGDRPPDAWLAKMTAVNPGYGEGYALVAHHLVLNRRYDDGIEYYRKAIAIDQRDWNAHSQLGINLMRLGREAEARKELELAYNNGFKDASTTNTLNLMNSYKNFATYETKKSIVRLHKKEAELLKPYIESELLDAIAAYEKKYKITMPAPVQLEVYPDHQDFAVRTMGMPGLGALGVTFGRVVAMDSPSGRKPGSFHWASTLWHELSHVFILTATDHRVPRWFTEGLAVHEETAVHPDWGDRMTPEIIAALKDKKMLPVAELDRGFIRPAYPAQVIVSYYQGGQICDFIVEKWGFPKILAMVEAFKQRKSTEETFRVVFGMETTAFDKQFVAWLDARTKGVVERFDDWRKKLKGLAELANAKNHAEVLKQGEAIIEMYPDYVEAANAYEFVADAALAGGDKAKGIATLERYAKVGGRSPETLKKLAKLLEERGSKKEAVTVLEKLNWIYPVNDDAMHRELGELYMGLGQPRRAIREFGAVVASKPTDRASAYYNLARAYLGAGQSNEAEDQVLNALEAAPGFRPAQKLLLELNAKKVKR
ncbi:MAG: tetratricopeptide repeat protein [Bryobacteraceae bacterium]